MFIVLEKKNFIIFNIGGTKVIGNFTSDLKIIYSNKSLSKLIKIFIKIF